MHDDLSLQRQPPIVLAGAGSGCPKPATSAAKPVGHGHGVATYWTAFQVAHTSFDFAVEHHRVARVAGLAHPTALLANQVLRGFNRTSCVNRSTFVADCLFG